MGNSDEIDDIFGNKGPATEADKDISIEKDEEKAINKETVTGVDSSENSVNFKDIDLTNDGDKEPGNENDSDNDLQDDGDNEEKDGDKEELDHENGGDNNKENDGDNEVGRDDDEENVGDNDEGKEEEIGSDYEDDEENYDDENEELKEWNLHLQEFQRLLFTKLFRKAVIIPVIKIQSLFSKKIVSL